MVQMNGAVSQVKDFHSFISSKAVGEFKMGKNLSAMRFISEAVPKNDFASAVYSNGYSLLHPNQKSDILARNVDLLA